MGSTFCALLFTQCTDQLHNHPHHLTSVPALVMPCPSSWSSSEAGDHELPHWDLGYKSIWPYGNAVAKPALDCAPCFCWDSFVTKLFISSLYLGIQIISSLHIATITNSSSSVGSAPESIHMGTFREMQGLCWKQLANIQNWRQDCKQYSSKHHKFSMKSVF